MGRPSTRCLEAWTLLAAIAARTTRIRLGVLVTSNTFRHPAILLKEAVTVDHISGGRLILGLGTGWHADEHRRYGIELPEPPERVDRFAEAVEIISLLMSQPRTTFHGTHYRLDDAPLEPRPIQQPRIPILIAAHRPRMLRLAARFADQWDTFAALRERRPTASPPASRSESERSTTPAARSGGIRPNIRRSTWASSTALESDETYAGFVNHHRNLGFSDFSVVAGDRAGRRGPAARRRGRDPRASAGRARRSRAASPPLGRPVSPADQ